MADLAASVLDRFNKKDEKPAQGNRHIKLNKAEMFPITCRELAAVIKKNPNHPSALAYTKAVQSNPMDEDLLIERVDLQALLDNREVVVTTRTEMTDVEGIQVPQVVHEKVLGEVIKSTKPSPPPVKPNP